MRSSSPVAVVAGAKTLLSALHRSISTSAHLSQEPQVSVDPISADLNPSSLLPPNPATGSPLYSENWRTPTNLGQSLVPLGLISHSPLQRLQSLNQNLDGNALLNLFADWTTSQRWDDMKQLFEFWTRSLDKNGKPNIPDVDLYNHYLRANLMIGASAGDLIDLVSQMDDFSLHPNTASFNLVLKAMYQKRETEAAQKLLQRMEETGKASEPDEESYNLVVSMLLMGNQIDAALTYIDKTLKCGFMLSVNVFAECVRRCANKGRLDTLVSIIEKCKTMDQNKALCPAWNWCNFIADVAIREDNSKLVFYAFEFMIRWIVRGDGARPPVALSADEGLIISALGTAARTYSPMLVDASWAILRRSLGDSLAPSPESYIAKIHAFASLGNLQKAFSTLRELESAYNDSAVLGHEDLFSPFTSLNPLVVACCLKGFETLDSVYFQLENLSNAEHPYKSVAALNCVILGCANIWDLDRAYQTFEAIGSSFGLSPNIHSYNALLYAFGKLKKTHEASRVFEHLLALGLKPNSDTYSLLIDAHLINRDPKSAISVINDMMSAGLSPSNNTLKKVKRRSIRELDHESDDRLNSLAKSLNFRLRSQYRKEMLFSLQYITDPA